ncbi:MAG: class IV adenylate cyclase [Candidatus Pacearchaeota archaeon]|jgi:predicted adenylyl cyclase CyaB
MEIEIKAKFKDKEKLKKRLRDLGAQEKGTKHQIDEYYNHPSIDTRETNEYIRLRYNDDFSGGVFAYHINIQDGVNKEYEVEISDIKIFKDILKGLKFPLLGVIDKKREKYILGDATITIDEVKNIDNFIEVEVDGEENEIDEKKKYCKEVLKKLNIPEENICKKIWLCDIATGRIKYP